MMSAPVYIVHCVDTEGPLYESPDVKFERLTELFGELDIQPTRGNLQRLKKGKIDLGGREVEIKSFLNSHSRSFMEDWGQLDDMLDRVCDLEFRHQLKDSDGNGWVYNWFCLDQVNFEFNPRRRALGHHAILDHYHDRLKDQPDSPDSLHWHFHPMSTYRDAHHCATHYLRDPAIYEILCRKILERNFFPAAYRAGFQAERPDSHWFLEQWIPFDISNMSIEDSAEFDSQIDFRNGRSGDWRRAPADWSTYHPSHDDYQAPGHCRRVIARALNVMNRIANIDETEMKKAFARANDGKPTIVGIATHDFRDMGPEIDHIRGLIAAATRKYPDVPFKYSEVIDAFRSVEFPDGYDEPALRLSLTLNSEPDDDIPFIEINCVEGTVFGPQPFLAIKTRGQRYIHDNLDFSPCGKKWYYAFHGDTLPLDDIAEIGCAASDRYGNVSVTKLDLVSSGEAGR